jgi:iron(III) transport system substrate-binding protein
MIRIFFYLCSSVFIGGFFLSCDRAPATQKRSLVLYTSIDEPIARPIVEEFEKQTGIDVTIVTDTEASKSVGLAERLRAEKDRPRADVWWGNEPFHTILLAEEGLFSAYISPSARDVPDAYKDPKHCWTGNGLRARVIALRTIESTIPGNLEDLPTFRNQVAMARPTAGTTGGHVAALYILWDETRADEFFRKLREAGIKVLGGNGPVAQAVADGQVRYGLTDNDDVANLPSEKRSTEAYIPPDGTLMIPTTVALVAGRPESAGAKKLVDYLLSPAVEKKLIDAQFAGWSIRGGENQPKAMQINYVEVARKMPEAVRRATAILEGREP